MVDADGWDENGIYRGCEQLERLAARLGKPEDHSEAEREEIVALVMHYVENGTEAEKVRAAGLVVEMAQANLEADRRGGK